MSTETILKRINISTAIVLASLVIAALVLLFYKPVATQSTLEQKNQALEDLRQAQMNLTLAKLDSIRLSQVEANDKALQKDAELSNRLTENTNALNKIKNEKVRDFTDYSSLQLQREVSDLVRFYETTKLANSNTAANRR